MANLLNVSKIILIILLTLATDILMRDYAVPRNEKRSLVGALRSRSPFISAADVTKTAMTSSQDGSTVADGSTRSIEQHFLRRLGIEKLPLRRSKRSKVAKDAIPGYLTEILRKFQRQTRKTWNTRKQKDKETLITGVVPYKGRTLEMLIDETEGNETFIFIVIYILSFLRIWPDVTFRADLGWVCSWAKRVLPKF